MKELRFKELALSQLKQFIRNYEQAYFELYRDSGVWNEEVILQSYRESAQKLYLTILEKIENHLKPLTVLGRKPGTRNEWQELDFYVGERLIIVYYSEDIKQKVRFIESIAIDRKPIIF